ncbi:Putative transcriptional regulator DJ-1 [Plasmopara halstedii]|uniref:Putative transcriptional regulator DJ-1 n=1 Tax=Plasmopara halstedii TaxID=4781 RepID=A0A0P1B045_PLAHL|nr:Putative transcriptional regulator DJ-1 [Plasmopara halstedii]CEG48057.1 Putative transcriptional regulator DJ-1 [Plasmopara halstedii]|eukprot:XP_024584426.1 Putative transcriptional regulator DJ-1 [Plasmopara halstedii]
MLAGSTAYVPLGNEYLPVQALPHVKPRALIVVADGSEELETLVLSDVLIRGGLHVTIGSVGRTQNNIIMGNHGLRILAEKPIEECSFENFEILVLPGVSLSMNKLLIEWFELMVCFVLVKGDGASHLRDSDLVIKMLLWQKQAGRWIAACSSAPAVVLNPHGLLGERATCSIANEPEMTREFVNEDVVVDTRCVTCQGPGVVLKFALTLVKLLNGEHAAKKAATELLYPWP